MRYPTYQWGSVLASLAIAACIVPPAQAELYLAVPITQRPIIQHTIQQPIIRRTYLPSAYPSHAAPANFNHGYSNNLPPTTLYRGFQIPQPLRYPSLLPKSYPPSQQVITFPRVQPYQPTYLYPVYSYPSRSYRVYGDRSDPYQRNSYSVYPNPGAPLIIYQQRY